MSDNRTLKPCAYNDTPLPIIVDLVGLVFFSLCHHLIQWLGIPALLAHPELVWSLWVWVILVQSVFDWKMWRGFIQNTNVWPEELAHSNMLWCCELLISMAAAVCNSVCEKVLEKFKLKSSLHSSHQMLLSALFDSKRVCFIDLSDTLGSVLKSLSVCSEWQQISTVICSAFA